MSDNVEHPSHYNTGSVETIDAIKSALGDGFLDYCLGNVIKYAWRCKHKGNTLEDLRKASKYLEWAIEEAKSEVIKPAQTTKTSDASLPDPGEGYRLLSKDPPERVVRGDEFLAGQGAWVESGNWHHGSQTPSYYYRRKIEATEWIPKVGDKVRVRCFGRIADGKIGVVVEDYPEDYAVRIVGENFKSCNLKAEHLELIEAAQ